MGLDKLTTKQIKQLQSLLKGSSEGRHPYRVGKNYFIRTVTHHHTGKLIQVTEQELVLLDAAWIADDGRFHDALENGEFAEVEPFPDGEVIIGRGTVIDAVIWKHKLPRAVK